MSESDASDVARVLDCLPALRRALGTEVPTSPKGEAISAAGFSAKAGAAAARMVTPARRPPTKASEDRAVMIPRIISSAPGHFLRRRFLAFLGEALRAAAVF